MYLINPDYNSCDDLSLIIHQAYLTRASLNGIEALVRLPMLQHHHGEMLCKFAILYAPYFVINAGGNIEMHHQRVASVE